MITQALAATGQSARGMARLIGVDERTMRRWIAGEVPMPGPAVVLLRLLARHPHLVTDLGPDYYPRAISRAES